MNQVGNFLVMAGEGILMLLFLAVGVTILWHIYNAYARVSRWIAWALMLFGILLCSFSLYGGVYFAILGSIMLSFCDTEKKFFKNGLPENVNPFSIVADICICDGILGSKFPTYFSADGKFGADQFGSCHSCFALVKVRTPSLSQAEAEALVRRLHQADSLGIVAVKEPYAHIIPADLKKSVRIAQSTGGRTVRTETYYLEG